MTNKNINELLLTFDDVLEKLVMEYTTQTLENFKKENNQITFLLNNNINDIKNKTNMLSNQTGLYLFEINLKNVYNNKFNSETSCNNPKNNNTGDSFFDYLVELWSKRDNIGNSTYPKFIKKRFQQHYCINPYKNSFTDNNWVPLYLGINKNIKNRVYQHIKCDSSTFSMKLSQLSDTAFKEIPIRVSVSEIPNINKDSRYIIVNEVEKSLREIIHPLVGKQ